MTISSLKYGTQSDNLLTVVQAHGGTVTISGSYVIHTFTSSGTFIPKRNLDLVDYLIVGGGGAGGGGTSADVKGGGGAGGVRSTVSSTGGVDL